MKKKLIIIMIILLAFNCKKVFGQTQKRNIEVSTSLSFWLVEEGGETSTLINLPIRLGYFITDEIEFEPEIILTIPEDADDLGYLIMGNLAYNFTNKTNTTPFILAGAGFGNAINTLSIAHDNDRNITACDLGAGIKTFITPSVALRAEYKFTHYSKEQKEVPNWYGGSDISNMDVNVHNIFMGFSIFFR